MENSIHTAVSLAAMLFGMFIGVDLAFGYKKAFKLKVTIFFLLYIVYAIWVYR